MLSNGVLPSVEEVVEVDAVLFKVILCDYAVYSRIIDLSNLQCDPPSKGILLILHYTTQLRESKYYK